MYLLARRGLSLRTTVPLLVMMAFAWLFLTMPEQRFINWLAAIERWGTWFAYLEGLLMWCASAGLCLALSTERRRVIWFSGAAFTVLALGANLLDYFITLQYSPDLSMELSPIWNNIVHAYGLQFALLFGFVGKVFLSIFAGLCFTFFLKYNHVLLPFARQRFGVFLLHLGERNKKPSQRLFGLSVVLAFYFAAMNLFCFYVAYANSLVNNIPGLSKLPPLPAAIIIALAIISVVFFFAMFAENMRLKSKLRINDHNLG